MLISFLHRYSSRPVFLNFKHKKLKKYIEAYPTCWQDVLSSVSIKDSIFQYKRPMGIRDIDLPLQPGLKRVEVPIAIRYKHQGENKVVKRYYATRTDGDAYMVE